MNVLLWYMREFYIAECEPGSYHARVVSGLYYLAKGYGNDEHRRDLNPATARLAESLCKWVSDDDGVPYWWYWFFCILIDADNTHLAERELFLPMTPQQLLDYFDKMEDNNVKEV